jgi:hypothetical protein
VAWRHRLSGLPGAGPEELASIVAFDQIEDPEFSTTHRSSRTAASA